MAWHYGTRSRFPQACGAVHVSCVLLYLLDAFLLKRSFCSVLTRTQLESLGIVRNHENSIHSLGTDSCNQAFIGSRCCTGTLAWNRSPSPLAQFRAINLAKYLLTSVCLMTSLASPSPSRQTPCSGGSRSKEKKQWTKEKTMSPSIALGWRGRPGQSVQ